MAGLILKLRAHEQILVNGVVLENGERNARLVVRTPGASILRLRDAIDPAEATTPLRRACYAVQRAVAGEIAPDAAGAELSPFLDSIAGMHGADHVAEARAAIARCDLYAALRALRRLLPLEEPMPVDAAASRAP